MSKAAAPSAKNKGAKKSVVQPPPPVLLRVNTVEELEAEVLTHAGAALVVVVSPLTASTTDAVVAALERLNSNRPPLLAEIALVVIYALPSTKEVCQRLGVASLPFVRSYAYGDVIGEFAGDNTEKVELLAKLAATAAAKRAALLAEQEKQLQAELENAAASSTAAAPAPAADA
jgi:hypothetical protein